MDAAVVKDVVFAVKALCSTYCVIQHAVNWHATSQDLISRESGQCQSECGAHAALNAGRRRAVSGECFFGPWGALATPTGHMVPERWSGLVGRLVFLAGELLLFWSPDGCPSLTSCHPWSGQL